MTQTQTDDLNQKPWQSWDAWLNSPPGQYVLNWEQTQFDHIVADIFGYHALQIGLPQLAALKENRMPVQIILRSPHDRPEETPGQWHTINGLPDELPFASQSIDLVVLPHVLEFADDPHAVLREVDRILMPEGRVIISGFNPASLWGLRQYWGRIMGLQPYLPREGQFIALIRIKDWLKLLDYTVDRGKFGCYRLPLRSLSGMRKMSLMEKAGDRWWPVLGSVFMIAAIKRVSTPTLVGRIDMGKTKTAPQLSPATHMGGHQQLKDESKP